MRTNKLIRLRLLPLDCDLAALWSRLAILVSASRSSDGTAVANGTGYFIFGWMIIREAIELVEVCRVFSIAPSKKASIDPSRLSTRSKLAL